MKNKRYFLGKIDKKRRHWLAPCVLAVMGCFIWPVSLSTPILGGPTKNAITYETAGEPEPGGVEAEASNAEASEGAAPDAAVTIVLDPGHGGEDPGCIWGGVEEKAVNLEIAERVRDLLEAKGYRVIMTRTGDEAPTKAQRAELSNEQGADAFVSIHQNAFETTDITGVETWYSDEASLKLARLLHKELLLSTGAGDRGFQSDPELYVTRETEAPACLVETGYLSNEDERKLLTDGGYQQKLARGIADGIDLFFNPRPMYLTFDDGPSAKYTAAVLDILKERGIKATFFLIGENVRKNPELARRIAAEGHTIGIHCDRHAYKEIYASVDSYLADFNKAYETIVETTGARPEIFRFPGGSINAFNKKTHRDIIRAMLDEGFAYFDWNVCIDDAIKDPGTMLETVSASLSGLDTVVLLAHDPVAATSESLEDLLDLFSDYRMEALTPESKPVRFVIKQEK